MLPERVFQVLLGFAWEEIVINKMGIRLLVDPDPPPENSQAVLVPLEARDQACFRGRSATRVLSRLGSSGNRTSDSGLDRGRRVASIAAVASWSAANRNADGTIALASDARASESGLGRDDRA